MSENRELVIATLAASIITARGSQKISEIEEALRDAEFLLFPQPMASRYLNWQQEWRERETPKPLNISEEAIASLAGRVGR